MRNLGKKVFSMVALSHLSKVLQSSGRCNLFDLYYEELLASTNISFLGFEDVLRHLFLVILILPTYKNNEIPLNTIEDLICEHVIFCILALVFSGAYTMFGFLCILTTNILLISCLRYQNGHRAARSRVCMIEFRNVTKRYGRTTILDDVSFTIERGQFVVLIGPSGCGKTTTLRTINRLIEPKAGTLFIDGEDVTHQNPVELRRKIGYVIQQIGLFPNMTVEQNISVVPKLLKHSRAECEAITRELLALVDMPYEENASKYPSELSGGQQQRIGVLRALAASPPIVLMDEPFGALDPVTRESLQEEVKRIQRKLKKTIVFVTHDMDEALRLADTIIFMDKGRILQMATPEEMLQNPADPLIKSFLGRHTDDEAIAAPKKAEAFMKRRVYTVHENAKTLESIERMRKREVNSLVVIDDDERFLGTVSIEAIKERGKAGHPIREYINGETLTVHRSDDAKEAFDKLLSSSENYVIVLNDDRTVAGIITRTSTAKAMGEALWGEMDA